MEPLNDDELNQLLRKWEAPAAPRALGQKVFGTESSIWRRLWTRSFRVPVPVAIAAAFLVALWLHYSTTPRPAVVSQPERVHLAGFKPVSELKPVLYSGGQK